MNNIGVRTTESGDIRVTESNVIRVTETFNRAQAMLLGTSAIYAQGLVTVIIRDSLTTSSFRFIGTTMSDHLVPAVNPGPGNTIVIKESIREFDVPARIRTIFI